METAAKTMKVYGQIPWEISHPIRDEWQTELELTRERDAMLTVVLDWITPLGFWIDGADIVGDSEQISDEAVEALELLLDGREYPDMLVEMWEAAEAEAERAWLQRLVAC